MTVVERPSTAPKARPLRVAVMSGSDPANPTAASGSGYGLVRGFRELGHAVVPIHVSLTRSARRRARLSALVEQARMGGRPLAELWRAAAGTTGSDPRSFARRSRVAQAQLEHHGPFDLVVQASSDFLVNPGSTPLVTREDVTVTQARAQPTSTQVYGLSDHRYEIWRDQQAELYRRATACGVTSSWTGASLVEDYGVDPSHVVVLGVGANHAEPEPCSPRDWTSPRFLFVGMDWQRKGGPELLEAFQRVRESVPHARLDLVGDHPHTDLPGVHGHGPLRLDAASERQRLRHLFASATCVVVPSRFEPTGIVFAEAAHAGIGSIGSTAGGSATVIGDGGQLVPPCDVATLTEAMLQMTDADRARTYGAVAQSRAAEFTWTMSARRLLAAAGLDVPVEALA